MAASRLDSATMTATRNKSDQILDSIIAAGALILALMAPMYLAPPKGDVYYGEPFIGIVLATILFVYIFRHFREATSGSIIKVGDLIAKVVLPIATLLPGSWLAFTYWMPGSPLLVVSSRSPGDKLTGWTDPKETVAF